MLRNNADARRRDAHISSLGYLCCNATPTRLAERSRVTYGK